ncbi:ABC transporter permease [Rhodococcoides kyotonense]|uniref:Peptide/nickel transport system permease protein n=1 Tax=Rhodococcoides kyotonense TaxID=398843 RepID=A0A239N364_9NOCA|nr:ABC transporter permease [Rhodococcus kyotonensis]SNT48609.1 peptide/nickel transport system permease protein [Rhodococcus kyotonensis]
MRKLVISRIVSLAGLLLALATVIFLLNELSPSDPAKARLGQNATPDAVAAERARLGLDDPFLSRFVSYIHGLLTGDFGVSFRTDRPVLSDLAQYFPATIELVASAAIITLVLAVLFAVSSVLNWPGSGIFRSILLIGSTAPTFVLGIAGVVVFYQVLGWLPASGRGNIVQGPTGLGTLDGLLSGNLGAFADAILHIVLPATALAIGPALSIGRVLRSGLIETMDADFIRTARAKGILEIRIVAKHVLRNSITGALSMTGLQVGSMFAGAVVVESIFSWPGLGSYLAGSINVADFPAIAGVTLVLGVMYVTANTIVDIAQGIADPRINV